MNHPLLRTAFVGLLLFALTVVTATAQQASTSAASSASVTSDERPTNIILLIPDGFGPASATMARDYLRAYEGVRALAFDSIQTGSIRTFSTSSRVTDSAAGATAFATGHKTYNGAIAVDTLKQPVATILQAANRRGMATGLVQCQASNIRSRMSYRPAHDPGALAGKASRDHNAAQGPCTNHCLSDLGSEF